MNLLRRKSRGWNGDVYIVQLCPASAQGTIWYVEVHQSTQASGSRRCCRAIAVDDKTALPHEGSISLFRMLPSSVHRRPLRHEWLLSPVRFSQWQRRIERQLGRPPRNMAHTGPHERKIWRQSGLPCPGCSHLSHIARTNRLHVHVRRSQIQRFRVVSPPATTVPRSQLIPACRWRRIPPISSPQFPPARVQLSTSTQSIPHHLSSTARSPALRPAVGNSRLPGR